MKLQRLGIDVVGGCNLRCVGCPNSTLLRKIQYTNIDNFSRILSNIDVKHIEFLKLYNFGETLLHPRLNELLKIIKNQKWSVKHVEISTNGQVINEDMLRAIFNSRIITRFGVSCDGDCTAEEYERLRPPAKWDNLKAFLETTYAIRYGFDFKIKFFLKILCSVNKKDWRLFAKQYGYDIQWRKWRKAPDSIKYQNAEIKVPNHACRHVESSRIRCYIDWNGDVIPCCNHPKAAVFGNLKEQKFSEIYRGKKRKAFIDMLNKSRRNSPICGKCEVR
ncbi:MAG: radical SAM/SPASM domain-containing protein [Desulfobacterales bacterium]